MTKLDKKALEEQTLAQLTKEAEKQNIPLKKKDGERKTKLDIVNDLVQVLEKEAPKANQEGFLKSAAERRRHHLERRDTDGFNLHLKAEKRPGYVRRWVNDTTGRVGQLLDRGYEYVKNSDGHKESRYVGIDHTTNKPLNAYLLEISEEWYHEDQKAKFKKNDAVTEGLIGLDIPSKSNSSTKASAANKSNFYGKIEINDQVNVMKPRV